ncbi:MAG: ribonuclease Z [Crenarchaeota archaeon]|nr:ribonuclease Z [Thermoproteota archaeon]
MSIYLTFLGTSAAVPTNERSLPAVLLSFGNEQFLFDCGEGVQRQIIKAKTGLHKPIKIFITHLHGDHVLGLPGLLQTMALLDRQRSVDVYGPVGVAKYFSCLRETLQFNLTFQVNIFEIQKPGIICDEKQYFFEAQNNNHTVNGFSYAFIEKPRPGRFDTKKAIEFGVPQGPAWSQLHNGQDYTLPNGKIVKSNDVTGPKRKGRKIVYSGDTKPSEAFIELASQSDIIIHEATFDDDLIEKANLDGHSTPSQAALQAKKAKAKQLILTHISARYTDDSSLLTQAQKIFPNTQVAKDFLVIALELKE